MRYILFFIMLFSTSFVMAQQRMRLDTAVMEERSIDKQSLQKIKEDKAFDYDRYREPGQSLWAKFWNWFWSRVLSLLSSEGGKTSLWVLFIVIGVGLIVFFVFKVLGMNKGGLFGRSTGNAMNYNVSTEDINQINFEAAIQEAIDGNNYRLAIRLMYLQVLKKLADDGLINWQINKTNTDYIQEIAGKPMQQLFITLTGNFEYTWYGEGLIEPEKFAVLQHQFQQFNKQLA